MEQIPKREYKPTPYATQFLLLAYKTGFYLSDKAHYSTFASDAIIHLAMNDYLKVTTINDRHRLLSLTQKGVEFIKQRFVERLSTGFIYHIYPILVKGDTIEVTKTLENDVFGMNTFVRSPHSKLPAGTYTLERIDKYSAVLFDQTNNERYRVRTYQARDFLKLKLGEVTNVDEEMCKRFGCINVKYTSKQLGTKITDNLQLIKLITELHDLPAAQGRIEGAK